MLDGRTGQIAGNVETTPRQIGQTGRKSRDDQTSDETENQIAHYLLLRAATRITKGVAKDAAKTISYMFESPGRFVRHVLFIVTWSTKLERSAKLPRSKRKRPEGISPGPIHAASRPRFEVLRGFADRVHIVVQIPLSIGPGVKALSLTAETDPPGSTRLSVLHVSDETARQGASATAEISVHAFVHIVHADFASPAPPAIGSLAAFRHLPTDRRETLCIGVGGFPILETFPGNGLDSIEVAHL